MHVEHLASGTYWIVVTFVAQSGKELCFLPTMQIFLITGILKS